MKVNDIYLAFLSAFDSTDKDFGSFFSDFKSYSASLQSDIERSLTEIVNLTGSVLPTYENISATQYYADYGSHQVQLRINGSGINKLFGGDITTGIVSVSSITVDYPSEAVHLSVSGTGIFTNLDTGAISGSFRSLWFSTPWINVSAFGSISVSGSSVTSPLDLVGSLQNLSISYPKDSVLLSLVGEINYYQDALGKINYSGDLTEISLGNDKADLTIKGDLSCTFDDQNGLNLSGNTLTTGIISVSSIAVNYPSQSLHLAFSGLGSGISANLDTGAISGTFHSFHFTTPWLDVIASGSISVAGSSVLSSLNVVGALDALSITYPDEKFLLSILGDINYTQDASGQFHYDGGATDIRISKNGADLAIKGDISCAFDEQHGLGLSGSVHEIDVQLGDVLIECIGDIRFGAKGVESADIRDLSILVNGNHYDASTLNLKDLLVDWVGNDMIFVDQNGDWCINDAKFPLFSDTINYLLEKINPTPPTVLTFSPSDAATGVAVGHDIVLTFSEAIQAGTGAIEIHRGSATGELVEHYDAATSHNLTIVGETLTINPTENLANGTHYFVTFADGSVKDLAGNNFAGTTTYDFTTAGGNTGVSIDFNGTPVGTSSSYEVFQDFFFDTTKQSLPGYLGSVAVSPNDISDMFDANNDGVADSFTITWTDSAGKAWLTSGTTTFDANGIWLSLETTGAFPSQTPHYGRLAFDAQGKVVGVYALNLNPVFTLTPDTIAGDKLVATFTIPNESGTWSLLDNDHNGVVDHLTNAANYFYNNVQQTNTEEYAITWSDTNHFTASRIDRKIDFGTTFDSQGRPTTITYYTHGATEQDGDVRNDVPIVWLAKGVDNVVATFSFTSSTNTASASGKFFDTNGDSIPDQISVIETDNGVTNTKTGRLYGWESLNSNHPIVSIEVITSTDPSEFFTGTITGTSSNPTTLAMPSYFMGSNGVEIAPNITAIVTTTANSGTGSLRAAIEYLNASGGNDSNIIQFAVSGTIVIDPDNPLPVIAKPVSFVMDGNAIEVKLENAPVIDGIPAVAFLAESDVAVTIPENLTVTVNGSHRSSVLGSYGTLVLNEMAGVLNAYISDGDDTQVYSSAAVMAEDVLVNGDLSGSITVNSNRGIVGFGANHDVLVMGNLSGKIALTSSQGAAVAVGAIHDITIGGCVTSSAEIIVTCKNSAVGLGAPNGNLDIAGDMAGYVTVTSYSGVVYGVGTWQQGSARLGSYSGTIIGTAKTFAVGLGVGVGYLATADQQIPVLSSDAGNFTITNDFSGQVTLTSTDGFAIGVLAIQNLTIGGDLSGKVAVHAQNNAYGLHSAEDMVIGSLSGDISAISENSYSFGLWAKGELHGATAQPLLISGTVSAVGNIAGAVVAGGAMNLIISGTLSCSTTSVTGSAFSIISILSNTNGYESATVSDQVTVTGTGKLVGNVEFGAGDDTMTLQAGADVTGVAFLDGGIGTDRLGFSGYDVVDLHSQSGRVWNFEIIDLTDAKHNTLAISSVDDVVKVTDADHNLYIVGDSGDSVRFSSTGATFTSNETRTIGGVAYAHYITSADATVDLYVQRNLVVEFGDATAPTVTTFSPVDGATGVAVGSDIKLAFNENIQFGSGTIAIHVGTATGTVMESYEVATSSNVTIAGNTLTINPTADLVHGTHYFVTFGDGTIKDLAGNNSAGTNTYDFTTDALPLHQDLTGAATFWKTGTPITGVTSTLTTAPAVEGAHPVEFRNIQLADDGTRTLELWETSTKPVESAQLEFTLSTGSVATWQDATSLSPGWISLANTGISGQFILGSMGTTALPAGQVKLGTLTLTAPTNPQHFELLLTTGQLNNDTIPTFRIASDSTTTGIGIASDSTTTGNDGLYQHINISDGTYALTSAKMPGTAEADAVHANDALAALKMAVGMNPNTDGSAVSPYQFLAADVNKDGIIRAADALNILKMAVKLDTATANEWLFVPESVGSESMSRAHVIWPDNPVPVTLDVDQELHLIGIVKGDVDGSWVG